MPQTVARQTDAWRGRGPTGPFRAGGAAAWGAALALVCLGVAPASAAKPEPIVIRSSSGLFTVRGQSLGHFRDTSTVNSSLVLLDPSFLAVTGENVRGALGRELGLPAGGGGRILIDLHPLRFESERILIHSIRTAEGWSYRLEMPDEVEAGRLLRALVEVLLMEFANRQAGDRPAELPPWLAPGLTAHLKSDALAALLLAPNRPVAANRTLGDPLEAIRLRLQGRPLLSVDEMNWPGPDQFEGARAEQYEASAHLFVRDLLRLRQGGECLRQTLTLLPGHLNWQTSFLAGFRPHFERLLDVEKWWSLAQIGFLGRDPEQTLSREESLKQLDETLYTPVQVRLSEGELPHESQVSLQTVLTEWPDKDLLPLLRAKVTRLAAASRRFSPETALVAEGYRAALERHLQARERTSTAAPPWSPFPLQGRALIEDTLRSLKAWDRKREQLWSAPAAGSLPRSGGTRGSSSRTGVPPSNRSR